MSNKQDATSQMLYTVSRDALNNHRLVSIIYNITN
jgi:hypothetical protein